MLFQEMIAEAVRANVRVRETVFASLGRGFAHYLTGKLESHQVTSSAIAFVRGVAEGLDLDIKVTRKGERS